MTTKTKQPPNNECGFPNRQWDRAKAEALTALRRTAREESTIYYSELVQEISAISFEFHGTPLNHLLAEISLEEHEAGRGMLSVVCVCKDNAARGRGQVPGNGFFICPNEELAFWVRMLQLVYNHNRIW